MTAIVGVLNKHGAAIAADSAVTMGNTHKVVNSANKIFTLSKYHPVAVMTYNCASFMGTPWDIIIKEYRKQLGDRNFPSLKEYVDNFISFLHARNFFCDTVTQMTYLFRALDFLYSACCNEISLETGRDQSNITQDVIEKKLMDWIIKFLAVDKCPEFLSYSYSNFNNVAKDLIIDYAKSKSFGNVDLLAVSVFRFLTSTFSPPFYTGLVFVGYGDNEIYPSLYPMNVCLAFDNHLKYYVDTKDSCVISERGTQASIVPFAQTDVTQTIIRGINPSFQDIIYDIIGKSIKSLTGAITNILDKDPAAAKVSDAVKKLDLDGLIDATTGSINKNMRETYTDPLLNTVVSLDKEDMANMAESFISLTSLVRRMQPGEETVGGPVDVAFISKGDGFVWINRKHYFKPELNAHFFNNYFR